MTEDSYPQKMWLDLSSLPFYLSKSPLEFSDKSHLPFSQASSGQCKNALFADTDSLLSFLSLSKSLKDPHELSKTYPGVPDMFFLSVPEHNGQQACLQSGHSGAPGCGPDGADTHLHPHFASPGPPSTFPPPTFSHGESHLQHRAGLLTGPTTLCDGLEEGVGARQGLGLGHKPPDPAQPWGASIDAGQPEVCEAVLEAGMKEQTQLCLSRQASLVGRAGNLQTRLQALLGEHALLHCSQLLEGLKTNSLTTGTYWKTQDAKTPPFKGHGRPGGKSESLFGPLSPATELQEFVHFSQGVLRGLQEDLDSEATASSSSDEETEENKTRRRPKSWTISRGGPDSQGSSEWRWLEERAEVGSRWSWLQLRLAELEGRIQQLGELHKHIRSTKGGVMLAESQPLTDSQIQQILLRETAGLSYTAGGREAFSDPDNEPSSPMRLLHNIQRQSAELSQIVNCLMPPLSLSPFSSPVSKQPQSCRTTGKRAFCSNQRANDIFSLVDIKRRRVERRRRQRLLQEEATRVCARTRPLVSYHKPRLFSLQSSNTVTGRPQDLESTTNLSSSSSSMPSFCSSCDPLAKCQDPACSSSSPQTSRILPSVPHPVLSLSSDTPLSHHLQGVLAREEWSQRPLVANAKKTNPAHHNRLYHSSTPLHKSYNYRHHRDGIQGLSPVRGAGSAQTPHRRANRRRRKRRQAHRHIEDEDYFPYQVYDPMESSEEVLEETYTPQAAHTRRPTTQGPVRRRQGESVYNIDDVVIPGSLACGGKVEKLAYKNILTPSWRVVDLPSLTDEKGEDHRIDEAEDLTDEGVAQRHLASEQKERQRWSSCDKNRRYRRPTSGEGLWGWTLGSSGDWSGSQPDTDKQPSTEWQPEEPWQPRVFPLGKYEEEALCCDEKDRTLLPPYSNGEVTTETSSLSTSAPMTNDYYADISSGLSFNTSLPSAGQRGNGVLNSS